MSIVDHAISWIRRGYHPIPLPYREKGPKLENWPQLHITAEDVPRYFNGHAQNLGVLLGEPYGNCDIDLDCLQALTAWPHFAPDTGIIFGRKSKPRSHWLYRIDPPARSVKYLDPVDGITLLEFRCLKSDGTAGLQTMVPPSVHPSGEPVEFFRDYNREPANVDATELGRAVRWTAAVALLARHWPQPQGGRHDAFLALAGALAHAKWGLHETAQIVCGLYQTLWPGSADLSAALRDVESTYQRHDDGHDITGLPHLEKYISRPVARQLARWLGLHPQPQAKAVFAVRVLPLAWRVEGGQMEWIIEDLLAASSVTLLSGDSGIGKSTLALQLAGCVAHGTPFLGRGIVRRPVLYIDRENPLFVVQERLQRLRIAETCDLIIWGQWNDPQPQGPDADSVLKFCIDERPVVIFDTLIAFHTGDEQSAVDTRKHMGQYRKLAGAGAAVIVLHNTGKSETSKQYRGSSDIKASLDMAYLLECVGDGMPGTGLSNLRLVPFKTRVEPIHPLHLAYVDGRFEVSESRRATEWECFERALRLHPNSSGRELIRILAGEIPKHRVATLLLDGIQKGLVEVTPGGRGSGQRYQLRPQDDL